MLKLENYINPTRFGLAYAGLAILTSLGSSLYEGSFMSSSEIIYNGVSYEVYAFRNNYSTLIDFALLNPLMIYLLLRSFKGSCSVYRTARTKPPLSLYHLIGMILIAGVMTGSFMTYYFDSFLEGTHFDAIIRPLANSEVGVTMTGWLVFSWTSLCMFISLLFSFFHIPYLRFLLTLKPRDILYNPHDEDNVGGQKALMRPILDYFYAAFVMLLIFIVFQIYDSSEMKIEESNRIYGFLVFVLVAGPVLFIPIFHLRKLMLSHRNKYIKTMRDRVMGIYSDLNSGQKKNDSDIDEQIKKLDYVDRYQKLVKSLPTWPLPKMEFTIPLVSLIGAIIKITQDVLTVIN